MNFLRRERATLESFLPTLDEKLRSFPLADLEQPGNPALTIYRELGGPALLIPVEHGGLGATPLQAAQIHRALASRSPSLAIAITMHNFSVGTLVEYSLYGDYGNDFLKAIAADQLLLASGFAEGRSGTSIMVPMMQAEQVDGGYRVNGSKKPCSLTNSMHMLTASVAVSNGTQNGFKRAVAIIPADSEGIERKPFWKNWVLGGAESDELILKDVFVPDQLLFFPETQADLDAVETGGFLWFEILISASYVGMASALVERVLRGRKGDPAGQAQLAIELDGAMAAIEGMAHLMMEGERSDATLAHCLLVRFAVQQAIARAATLSAELLGGMAFVESSDVSYLLAASRALAFHPPSRISIAGPLAQYLSGEPFRMV
jgi:alkylation response protein AidB-like acyl-CoA dehydrogenase